MSNILTVDDNLQNLLMLEALLKNYGHNVTFANNGKEALDIANKNPPDLIITDILMPIMDGFELCRRCKSNPILSCIPFIFYTATYTDPKDEQFALNLGADMFIIKPEKPEILVEAIHGILEKYKNKEFISSKESLKDETKILNQYNDVLFRKLEKKIIQLEEEINNRKRAEENILENERKFRAFFENSPIGKSITGIDGKMQVNNSFCKITGYSKEELQDKKWEDITHPDDIKLSKDFINSLIEGKLQQARFEKRYINKNGNIVWVDISTYLQRDNKGTPQFFITSVIDITKRKQDEEKIIKALAEKEILINELYHRTKNNMQVIISMLNLKASYSQNHDIKNILKDIESRIHSMALVQNKLFQSKNLYQINLKDYIIDLTNLLVNIYMISENKIKFNLSDMDDIFIMIDSAIPCGLIINELVINSIKYAFPDKYSGEIKISLKQIQDQIIKLTVSDNGVGVEEGFDFRENSKMGMKIIFDIAENQLNGKVIFKNENGLSCVITFKNKPNKISI
jgi:PAS domain S-box-containing protein